MYSFCEQVYREYWLVQYIRLCDENSNENSWNPHLFLEEFVLFCNEAAGFLATNSGNFRSIFLYILAFIIGSRTLQISVHSEEKKIKKKIISLSIKSLHRATKVKSNIKSIYSFELNYS